MCDYSLEGLPNRLAVRGERLETHRFRSGSIGMASQWDIAAATQPKLEQGESRGWWAAVVGLEFRGQLRAVHVDRGAP